jgi:predicted O-linked N-acetylglucosamine transferase (SPINDLY family)
VTDSASARYLQALASGAAREAGGLAQLAELARDAHQAAGGPPVQREEAAGFFGLSPGPFSEHDRFTTLAGQHRAHGLLGLAEAVLALAVQRAPDSGQARANHALALHELGRHVEALAQAERAVAAVPGLAAAWFNLGLIRAALHDGAGAAQAHAQAQALSPQSGMHHQHAGLELKEQGRLLEAQGAFRYAMTLDGASPEAWVNLGNVLLEAGDAQAAEDAALAALAMRPQDRRAATNLLMAQQYNPCHTAETLRESAMRWGQLWQQPQAEAPAFEPFTGGRPLRVGYLSSDFRQHPIGWLLGPVLAGHDAATVELHAFDTDNGRHAGDPLKAELRCHVAHWHEVGGLDDGALAARVRAAGIDVLVELAGHTDGGRLGVLAHRPAPVQLSWLGYFASTGVPAVDGVVTGSVVGDAPAAAWYTEPLLHLGRPHIAWRAPSYAPAPAVSVASSRQGGITFGSFNTAAKLSDATVALWARLLLVRPDSRLLLRRSCFGDPAFAEHTRRRFASHGVAPERIVTAPALPHDQMLAAYAELDIALDPAPFSGLITSLEALWMGLPVVTLSGLRPVSRQTEMVLRALGQERWIATTPEAWLQTCLRLADDTAARSAWLHGARAAMSASPLMDGADLARQLEALYLRLRATTTP